MRTWQTSSVWRLLLPCMLLVFAGTGCNELTQVQKSTNIMEKYSYAKKYYNTGKYSWAAMLLEEVTPYLEGSSEGEQALFLQGEAYYKNKQYSEAQTVFKKYYTTFPHGEHTELARFYSGFGLAQDISDPRLDQTRTYEAIRELQLFLDYYPQSDKAEEAKQLMFGLQENLAQKELYNIELYYNLGNYIFNNYESCIITARNALKNFPYSVYKQDIHYYIVASLYQIAKNSIEEKQQQRLRDLRDEYYNFINEFPEGKHRKKVDEYFVYAEKNIKES